VKNSQKAASAAKLVGCPTCGKPAAYNKDNPYRPFCSERCKLVYLGAWANENYRVEVKEADENSIPSESPPDS
jgi:endogenous inhibitor of DNA gyrase (YacG/DUF329 family)